MKGLALFAIVCAVFLSSPNPSSRAIASPETETHRVFFQNLTKLCGQRFEGKTEFPPDPKHPLAGKKLLMIVESCSEKEIRIPFNVGEDKSRTWILTLTDKGLLFKHDHRHPDGTPDRITMYGGWAAPKGTSYMQRFPADPETTKLIPEAATNVWTLQIIPDRQIFSYYLERNNEPRYEARFSLNTLSK